MSAGYQISVSGFTENFEDIEILARVLQDRRGMHAAMAAQARLFIQEYLLHTPRHKTAERLGATPTGFRARNAEAIRDDSNAEEAAVLFPRSTGLGRAFHDVVILPGTGKTYLTIPDHPLTYGRGVRDFPEETFKFAILHAHRPFPVLLFAEGPNKGDVAYWLRRRVIQKQDRSLLPSDAAIRETSRRAAVVYLTSAIYRAA